MKSQVSRFLVIAAASALVLVAALAAFVLWGPIPVSDKRVMLDFMLGRGIDPPNASTVAERLAAPAGMRVQVYSADVPLARVMLFTP